MSYSSRPIRPTIPDIKRLIKDKETIVMFVGVLIDISDIIKNPNRNTIKENDRDVKVENVELLTDILFSNKIRLASGLKLSIRSSNSLLKPVLNVSNIISYIQNKTPDINVT